VRVTGSSQSRRTEKVDSSAISWVLGHKVSLAPTKTHTHIHAPSGARHPWHPPKHTHTHIRAPSGAAARGPQTSPEVLCVLAQAHQRCNVCLLRLTRGAMCACSGPSGAMCACSGSPEVQCVLAQAHQRCNVCLLRLTRGAMCACSGPSGAMCACSGSPEVQYVLAQARQGVCSSPTAARHPWQPPKHTHTFGRSCLWSPIITRCCVC